MECLIGIRCKDFVIVTADMTNAHSIVVMKTDENKLHKLSDKIVLAVCGDQGDRTQFAEYIAKNIQLYKMRNVYELSPSSAATFTRRNLADALRTSTPYQVNMLMAGYDALEGAQLFFIDYLASMAKLNFASHGYGGYFTLSIIDRYYRENMSETEAYELLKVCIREVQKRLVVNLSNFKVQIIDKNGIRDLPTITPKSVDA